MAVLKFSILAIFLLASCASAENLNKVTFNNQLNNCISISNKTITNENLIPIVCFDLNIIKPIGECGCKSALGSYTVFLNNDDYKSFILGGKVILLKSGKKYLPITSEKSLINNKDILINISCSTPE
jgi:hypothetical protein